MGDTTITVSDERLERFKQLKAELDEQQSDVPDHSADSFLAALMDTWEAAEDGYYSEPSADEIAEQLKDEISMANEPAVEIDVDSIMKRIDDLESQLPRKVANEVQQR